MKAKGNLLRDAAGLEDKIAQWSEDPSYIKGAELITEAIQNNNIVAQIYQSLSYPEFALLAYHNQAISLAQFTSVTLQWSGFKDYANDAESVQHHTLSSVDSNATELLRPFLQLLVGDINVPLPQVELQQYIGSLLDENVPTSERTFTILTLKEGAELPDLFYALREIGFGLFLPIRKNGQYQVLIPTFSMLQNLLCAISNSNVELCPAIGDTSAQGVLDYHHENRQPLGISFPGYEHTEADGYKTKMLLFVFHDIYHIALLIFVKLLKLINDAAQLGTNYLNDKAIPENSIMHQRVGFLVDAEMGEFYRLAVVKKLGMFESMASTSEENFTSEMSFARLLTRVLIEKIPQLEDDKIPAIEHQIHCVASIMAALINRRQYWQENGIDVAKCMLNFCRGEHLIEHIQKNYAGDDDGQGIFRMGRPKDKGMEVQLELLLGGAIELKKIAVALLSTDKYHALLNADAISWLQKIPAIQQQLFAAINSANEVDVHACLQIIRAEQLPITLSCRDGQMQTPLSRATSKKNTLVVKALLEFGADPNEIIGKFVTEKLTDKTSIVLGTRAVHVAAMRNNVAVLAALIEKGALLEVYDTDYRTPIDIAMECGFEAAFSLLIQHCNLAESHLVYRREKSAIDEAIEPLIEVYQTTQRQLVESIELNQVEKLRKFLQTHPNFTPDSPLMATTYDKAQHAFLLVPEDYKTTTAFEIAMRYNNLEILEVLFECATINHARNEDFLTTIRQEVIRAGQWNEKSIKMLELVFRHGLRINHYESVREGMFGSSETKSIWTLLRDISYSKGFFAVMPTGNVAMSVPVRKLCIEKGAAINEPNKNGMPELVFAALVDDIDYAKFLLDHGAEINMFDRSSSQLGTALHVACGAGHKAMVELLRKYGADLTVRNLANMTPQQLAKANGFAQLLADCLPECPLEEESVTVEVAMPGQLPEIKLDTTVTKISDFSRMDFFSQYPQLKRQMLQQRSNPLLEIGRSKLCHQLNSTHLDYNHPIFADTQLWQYALLALANNKIDTTQFTTLAIRSAYLTGFTKSAKSVEHFSMTASPQYAEAMLRRFLHTSDEKAEAIIQSLKNSLLTQTETCFSVITLKENEFVWGIMSRLYDNSPMPLLPIKDRQSIMILVPSFTMMQTVVRQLFPQQLQLTPILGHLEPAEVLSCLRNNMMPLELNLSSLQHVDAIFGCYARALMLSANQNRALLFKLVEIEQNLAMRYPAIHKLSFLKMFTNEEGHPMQHYINALINEKTGKNSSMDEELLYQSLLAAFGSEDETFNVAEAKKAFIGYKKYIEFPESRMQEIDASISALQQQLAGTYAAKHALLQAILLDMVTHRQVWKNQYQISVARFLDFLNQAKLPHIKQLVNGSIAKKLSEDRSADSLSGLIGKAIDTIIRPAPDDEAIAASIAAMSSLCNTATQFLASDAFSEQDQTWSATAMTLRDKLLASLNDKDENLTSLIRELHDTWQFNFSIPLLNGTDILHCACLNRNSNAVSLLLDYGISPNTISDIDELSSSKNKIPQATYPVHIAVQNNDIQTLTVLLKHKASLEVYNKDKLSPLSLALIAGYTDIIALCLQHIDISENYVEWLKTHHNIHPNSLPILENYFAFKYKLRDILEERYPKDNMLATLLEDYPSCRLDCQMPYFRSDSPKEMQEDDFMHCARYHRFVPSIHLARTVACVKLLHARGLDINAVDGEGDTLLMDCLACAGSSIFGMNSSFYQLVLNERNLIVDYLIQQSANVLAVNRDDESALGLAMRNEDVTLVNELLPLITKQQPDPRKQNLEAAFLHITALVRKNKCWTESTVTFCKLLLKQGVNLEARVTMPRSLFDFTLFSKPETQSLWQLLRSLELPLALRFHCVNSKADVDEPMSNGQSEIFFAIENDYDDYLSCLLERNACLNIRNNDNLSPIECANKLSKSRCVELLKNHHNLPTFGFVFTLKKQSSTKLTKQEILDFHDHQLKILMQADGITRLMNGKHKDLLQALGIWGDWDKRPQNGKPFYSEEKLRSFKHKVVAAYDLGNNLVPDDYQQMVGEIITKIEKYNALQCDEGYLKLLQKRSQDSEKPPATLSRHYERTVK